MEAPRNNSTKWSNFLNQFANSDLTPKEAETKLTRISKHIPAIFREISSSLESLIQLKNIFTKNEGKTNETRYWCYSINNSLAGLNPEKFSPKMISEIDPFFQAKTPLFNPMSDYEVLLIDKTPTNLLRFFSHIIYNLNNRRSISYPEIDKAYTLLGKISEELNEYLDCGLIIRAGYDAAEEFDVKTKVGNLVHHFLVEYFSQGNRVTSILEKLTCTILLKGIGQISSEALWNSVSFETLKQNDPVRVIQALQRDMMYISPMILHNKKFRSKITSLLEHWFETRFAKIPMFQWAEKAKESKNTFIMAYLRLCSSVYKLDTTYTLNTKLVPTYMSELLYQKSKISLSDGPLSAKNYQLQLFYAEIASDAIPSPSKFDYTKTKISGALFQKMLDAFFSKGENKPELSTDELIEIYEFLYELTKSEEGVLEQIRAKLNQKFNVLFRVYNESETKSLDKLSSLAGPEAKKLHAGYVAMNRTTISGLHLHNDGSVINELVDYANPEDVLILKTMLDETKWESLYIQNIEILESYIQSIKAYFKLADRFEEKRKYQIIAEFIKFAFRQFAHTSREYINRIKESFPELQIPQEKVPTNLNQTDEVDSVKEFIDMGRQATLSIELNLKDINHVAIDQLKLLEGMNISKFTFLKRDELYEIKVVSMFPDAKIEYHVKEKSLKERAEETVLSWFRKTDNAPKGQ